MAVSLLFSTSAEVAVAVSSPVSTWCAFQYIKNLLGSQGICLLVTGACQRSSRAGVVPGSLLRVVCQRVRILYRLIF
uniref:RxLR effector candidate protein n=1 Tax=Hyaloperonospora arabidopsidis (strain Emoy2) TaxID=559515 RepID=M4BFX0_HYAAE